MQAYYSDALEKGSFWKRKCRWQDNIAMNLSDFGWIHLASNVNGQAVIGGEPPHL
jgi:hypothetical protein